MLEIAKDRITTLKKTFNNFLLAFFLYRKKNVFFESI